MNHFSYIFILVLLFSCSSKHKLITDSDILESTLNLPSIPYNYSNQSLPDFFSNQFIRIQNNATASNPITDWGATLGRVLFYDSLLSRNYTVSCATCHVQSVGFTDTAQFSKGFEGKQTKRHSMSLLNATYYQNGRFFWDERAATLEDQVLQPIEDPIEMGLTMDQLIARLNTTTYYPILFKKAFGNQPIQANTVAKALAQFVRSMISYRSKYDNGRAMVADRLLDFPNFTALENQGKRIFMTNTNVNCFSCHNTDVFITDNPRNNGLSMDNSDQGIYVHTGQINDMGKFKSPSLKNVAQRVRFMHNGQLRGLKSVLLHYNHEIKLNPNLDASLMNTPRTAPAQMNLTEQEINALEAFLHTLTDEQIIQDEKFSNPFR